MLLVLRNSLRQGRRAAWYTSLGCCLGIALHATAAVLGLSAVLAASATAYNTVKLAGAAYLAYLGIRMLYTALKPSQAAAPEPNSTLPNIPDTTTPRAPAFRQGLLTNLLNPKIALLFLTLLPQFVQAHEPRLQTTATLAAVFLTTSLIWWRLFTLALTPISRTLHNPRTHRTLDTTCGIVLLGLGTRIALRP
jgi:threonine/homoserine/homoserine lactone efflux protein